MSPKKGLCPYTKEGRKIVHDNISYELPLLYQMRNTRTFQYSIELFDNRISLYSAQKGKCAIMGTLFSSISDIHCHHKQEKSNDGNDSYENLVLICEDAHKLIHASKKETILKYLNKLKPTPRQLYKINYYRFRIGKSIIKEYDLVNLTVALESNGDFIDIY